MRKLGVLLAAGLLLFSVVSCTTKKNEDVSAAGTSTEATDDNSTTTTKKQTTTTEDSTSTPDSGSESSENSGDIPALGDLGDCLSVSLTWAGLFLGAGFATDEQKAELEDQLNEIKGKVPADIQDDMDTIREGMSNADGIVELGEYLDSDEFKQADDNIQQYFDETCGADSGN